MPIRPGLITHAITFHLYSNPMIELSISSTLQIRNLASGRWSNPRKSHRQQGSSRTNTQILWFQSSASFPYCTILSVYPSPCTGNNSHGPHQQGENRSIFYSTSALMRELIRINISFYQKVFLRSLPIVCPFQGTPNTSGFQCKQQICSDCVMGFWEPVFTG